MKSFEWMDDGACKDLPPGAMVPGEGDMKLGQMRKLCLGCASLVECRAYGLSVADAADPSMYGALTKNQRSKHRAGKLVLEVL